MAIQEIPLTADNQQFSIVLGGVTWRISIIWRDLYWIYGPATTEGSR
ncbi:bacteriophage protein [Escherichia coli]|uniref:Bacteriophage protein n=1 Tax=Escherichia coli TaxID=562 RepID=A0A2X1MUV8_ECOLX|nr:bacteriophage protein [Escherichia coli]